MGQALLDEMGLLLIITKNQLNVNVLNLAKFPFLARIKRAIFENPPKRQDA